MTAQAGTGRYSVTIGCGTGDAEESERDPEAIALLWQSQGEMIPEEADRSGIAL